jgi:hypothetical protein
MSAMSADQTDLDAPERDFLRSRSKQLFGNRDRIEVGCAIARSDDAAVSAADLSNRLNLPNNRVRAQLMALASVGLLEAMPHDGSGRAWYVRRESGFWGSCLELSSAWERQYIQSRSTASG